MKNQSKYCFACREPTTGRETFSIVDRVCHRECFKCQTCRQDLNSRMFCSFMGDIYCEKHHPNMRGTTAGFTEINHSHGSIDRLDHVDGPQCFCKRICFVCLQAVEDPKPCRGPAGVYHLACFRCFLCQKVLSTEQYRVVRRKFYCEPTCNLQPNEKNETSSNTQLNGVSHVPVKSEKNALIQRPKFKTVCFRCAKELSSTEHYIVSDKYYHRDCFKCQRCSRILTESRCTLVDDLPCCETACKEDKTISRPTLPLVDAQEKISNEQRSNSVILMKQEKVKEEKPPRLRQTCVANAEKVAKLQRMLEEIQSTALEDKNCYTCGKKVYPAEQLNTLSRIYHLKCFQCKVCQKVLTNKYQVLDGHPYCIPHYNQLSNMKCLSALNLSTASLFKEKAKQPESVNMHEDSVENPVINNESEIEAWSESLCSICAKRIPQGSLFKAKNRTYHRTCFRCQTCQTLLNRDSFGTYEGAPYCETHYEMLMSARHGKGAITSDAEIVAKSKTAVSDIIENGKRKATQSEADDTAKCYSCGLKVYQAELLNILKRTYHKNCFKCATCHKVLSVSRYGVHEGVPYCTAHRKQMTAKQPNVGLESQNSKTRKHTEESNKAGSPSRTRCFECGKYTNPMNSLILTDRVYHSDCLKCNRCQTPLGRWNFKEIDGVLFCSRHFAEYTTSHGAEQTRTPLPTGNIIVYQLK